MKAKPGCLWQQWSSLFFFFPEAEKEIRQINSHWKVCQISFSDWEIYFILFPPHTQHRSFSLLLLLYITLRNKAISKNTCLIIWLWSITLSLRIGFLTCQMWLSLPNSLSTYKVQLLGENWSKIETFAGVWARGCVSLKYDHPSERRVGSIGLGMSKYSHKNFSFLKKKKINPVPDKKETEKNQTTSLCPQIMVCSPKDGLWFRTA